MDVDLIKKEDPSSLVENKSVSLQPTSIDNQILGLIQEHANKYKQQNGANIKENSDNDSAVEYMPLTLKHTSGQLAQQNKIEELELRKRANEIIVPVSDELIKQSLIVIGEPIIYFGETNSMRRQRLRMALAIRGITDGMSIVSDVSMDVDKPVDNNIRPFTTDGGINLKEARFEVFEDAKIRTSSRLARLSQKKEKLNTETQEQWKSRQTEEEKSLYMPISSMLPSISVVGDLRPLTSITFSDDGRMIATSSWSGLCKVWSSESAEEICQLKGHSDRVIDLTFAPISSNLRHIATSGVDQTIRIWSVLQDNIKGKEIAVLKGHEDRVNILRYHPSGKWLFSTSHDLTWGFWDVEKQKLLLQQDGHSQPVFGLDVHPDGNLVATGSGDAHNRIWDIRSGKCIHTFTGHVKQVFGLSWHPDGIQLASCSEDHTVRIYDLRTRKPLHTLAAHATLISDVKFDQDNGKLLVTSGNDNVAKVWRTDTWEPICTLSGHDSRVTAIDISPIPLKQNSNSSFDGSTFCVATAGYDRTWKLWTPSIQ